jgi:hypothetical protein
MACPSLLTVIEAPNVVAIEWLTRSSIRFETLDSMSPIPFPTSACGRLLHANLNSKGMAVNE